MTSLRKVEHDAITSARPKARGGRDKIADNARFSACERVGRDLAGDRVDVEDGLVCCNVGM